LKLESQREFARGDRVTITKGWFRDRAGTVVGLTLHPVLTYAVQVGGENYKDEKTGILFSRTELELTFAPPELYDDNGIPLE
jgi:hypothetical protein